MSVVAKADAGARGKVTVRVLSADSHDSRDLCADAQQILAAGDSAYARGQAVTSGTNSDPNADAPLAYEAAAHQYLAAVRKLEPAAPPA